MKKNVVTLILLCTVCMGFGCGQQAEKATHTIPEPNLSTPGFLIDSHIHYRATDEWEKSFLEIFEKWNAIGCILVNMKDLDRGITFAKAHPDRVIPYAAIEIDSPTVVADIRKAYDMGYKGLGELFALNEWNYDDPKYDPMWAMAEKLGLPVAPHTGIHASGQFSRMRPGYLATVAVKFPNLIIHAAHFGNPWYNEAGEATRRNKNLYFDMTGSSLIKKDEDPGYWKEFLWWTPYIGKPHMPADAIPAFQKIVFATDESPSGLEDNIIRFNKMLDACGVSEETRKKCYYGTIAEIHGIDVSKYLK
ncbi:MAG: amidohydrolase family protein [Candidatus Latescibacteria bacterium]|nr:amidohydrolase family protein [Candidatus Latescibacterota bacterium]